MKALNPGRRCLIIAGPFRGVVRDGRAKVVRDRGRLIDVEIEVAGRGQVVVVRRDELRPERRTKDPTPSIWAEIQRAIARRLGVDLTLDAWWCAQHDRAQARTDPDVLIREARELERTLELAVAEAAAEVERAFREAFDPLPPNEKRKRWKRERARWLEVEPERAQVRKRIGADVDPSRARRAREALQRALRAKRKAEHPLAVPDLRTAPIAVGPDARAIEETIDRDPEVVEPYLVYADLLQAAGDPRGELIMLQPDDRPPAPDLEAAAKRLLSTHAEYFLGALNDHREALELRWQRGFIRSASIVWPSDTTAALVETLLALPSSRYLRALALEEIDDDTDLHEAFEILIRRRPKHLTSLRIGPDSDPKYSNWNDQEAGDLTELLRAFPDLEELTIRARRATFGEVELPKLRSLRLETTALTFEHLLALTTRTWPSLEELTLWFGASSYGASIRAEDLSSLLSGRTLPRLRRLALQNVEFADDLCSHLLHASELISRLDALDLAMGTMTDEGAETLCFGAKILKPLRLLDVRNNYIGSGMRKRLAALEPAVLDRPQRRVDDYDQYGPYRMVMIDDEYDL